MTKRADFVAEIDSAELACRIFEGMNGIIRPDGMTAREAMDVVKAEDMEVFLRVMEAAKRAAEYLCECVKLGRRTS